MSLELQSSLFIHLSYPLAALLYGSFYIAHMMSRIWEHKGAVWWLANKVVNSLTVLFIVLTVTSEFESHECKGASIEDKIFSPIIYIFILVIKVIKLWMIFIVGDRVMNETSNPAAPAPGDIVI